jgi:hypothetical protein
MRFRAASALALAGLVAILATPPLMAAPDIGAMGPVAQIETNGERVEVELLAVPGKYTVVVLYSGGHKQSRTFNAFLEHWGKVDPNVAVRLLDIDRPGETAPDLKSPIALRYRMTRADLPMIKVYDERGRLKMQGGAAANWVLQHTRRVPPPPLGKGPYPPSEMAGEVSEITHGNEVELDPYLSKDQHTIVMFHSPFCPPCRKFRPLLEELAERSDKYVLRKVDVNRPGVFGIDYSSPVSRQHQVPFLPFIAVANEHKELYAEGQGALGSLIQELDRLKAEQAAPAPAPRRAAPGRVVGEGAAP